MPTPTNTVIGVLGGPGCEPPSPVVGGEIQGTVIGTAMAYGQLQVADPTELTVGESIKFVLRMTGAGSLSANLTSPDGTTRPLDWGPEPHAASNYDRPGDEWGMGFSFDAPGCWALNLNRDGGDRATFWMTAQGAP
jgi:hypothetical protein